MDSNLNDPLTRTIIGLAMKVHKVLGPGFLESVYLNALIVELRKAGLHADEEKRVRVFYEDVQVGDFVVDILVENKVIIELKAVESLGKAHEVQTVNYLNATGLDIGLLINFGGTRLQFKRKFRQRGDQQQNSKEDPEFHPDKCFYRVKLSTGSLDRTNRMYGMETNSLPHIRRQFMPRSGSFDFAVHPVNHVHPVKISTKDWTGLTGCTG